MKDIGGLKEEVKKVREMIEIPLKRPELFEKIRNSTTKGSFNAWTTRNR